jgi:hypothetical protein
VSGARSDSGVTETERRPTDANDESQKHPEISRNIPGSEHKGQWAVSICLQDQMCVQRPGDTK